MHPRKHLSIRIAGFLLALLVSLIVIAYVSPPTFSPVPQAAIQSITMIFAHGVSDVFSGLAAILLAVLLVAIGFSARAWRKIFLFILPIVIFTMSTRIGIGIASANDGAIKEINLLLKMSPGAPTSEDVVNHFLSGGGDDPPLDSLRVGSPTGAYHLLPFRASGEFKRLLDEKPDSPRAQLERFIVVTYPEESNLEEALVALKADEFVASATLPVISYRDSLELRNEAHANQEWPLPAGTPSSQYGRQQMNSDAALARAGGHSLVGFVDSGLHTTHPSLRQFSQTGSYIGGNFVPAASWDVAIPSVDNDPNVDELQPVNSPPTSECYNGGLPLVPINGGHGTHTAGLVAANSAIPGGLLGTCRNCGIAVAKIAWPACVSENTLKNLFYDNRESAAITHLIDNGVQVINISLGGYTTANNICAAPPIDFGPFCTALVYARVTDTTVVAASGNWRTKIFFPASHPQSIAVGGVDSANQFWDKSPGGYANCPFGTDSECGSNYTTSPGTDQKQQELVAAADEVLSLTYSGVNWSPLIGCGDGFPGPGWGNGKGLCSGTSMSAPHVSGLVGQLRSINPLVLTGQPIPAFLEFDGLRTVLANTTFEAQASISVSPTRGYGLPDAEAAVKSFLGIVKGQYVKNRVTPLFSLYSTTNQDYAYTTFPQTAVALIRGKLDNGSHPAPPHVSYVPVGPYVRDAKSPGGTYRFPVEYEINPALREKARAEAYIFTTEFKPNVDWPDLIPVYLVDKTYQGGRDFMLVTSAYEIEQAAAQGYALRNIQGYIAAGCKGISMPCQHLLPFYRACKPSVSDCAHFVETDRATYESAGYTQSWLAGGSTVIGYAFDSSDYDDDGLPDGFERVVGTNPTSADSDGDQTHDGTEFPMIHISKRDPCSIPNTCP